jgi:hypothetical protein
MSIENILNNNEYKSIFLKAILLGINYGKSNNVNYYINNIEKEILELNEVIKNENKLNKLNKLNEIKLNSFKVLEKYEKNILILENQKKYTFGLIQTLSVNNYSYNYSKINLLKNNLIIINNEIEKNKILLKKNKDIINKNLQNIDIYNIDIHNIDIHNIDIHNKENISKSIQYIKPLQNIKQNTKQSKNSVLLKETNSDKNLIGELEKTLGNLSNFLIN